MLSTPLTADSSTRTYTRIEDVPTNVVEQLGRLIYTTVAPRMAATFRSAGCPEAIDAVNDEAGNLCLRLPHLSLPNPMTVSEIEKYLSCCLYLNCRREVAERASRRKSRGICSLDEHMEKGGRELPASRTGVPSIDLTHEDVVDLLTALGLHEDWLYVYVWVAMEDLRWAEVAQRIQLRCGIEVEVDCLRQRWCRLRKDLGPGVAAGLAGFPLEAFVLPQGHWATLPMEETFDTT